MVVIIVNLDFGKLGNRIKQKRIEKKLTQEQLAEIIGLTSVYISHIECGSGKSSIETLVKICNALDTTPDLLLIDSIENSKNIYIDKDISLKLDQCTANEIKFISDFISLLIKDKQ